MELAGTLVDVSGISAEIWCLRSGGRWCVWVTRFPNIRGVLRRPHVWGNAFFQISHQGMWEERMMVPK